MKLENKVAIVTGGAMGNGLGIVKVFLKYKAKVAKHYKKKAMRSAVMCAMCATQQLLLLVWKIF